MFDKILEIEKNDFIDFGALEGAAWRRRFEKFCEKQNELILEEGVKFIHFMSMYITKKLPEFKLIEEYKNGDRPLDDEVLVLVIPIMEEALELYITQKD